MGGRDCSGVKRPTYRKGERTVRDVVIAPAEVNKVGNTGEGTIHKTVGETVKFDKTGFPKGTTSSGYDLDNNGATVKGRGKGVRGIGLVEVTWNPCYSIMKNSFRSSIILHDYLHEFIHGRGVATSTMEENLAHHLTGMCHGSLFQALLDVQKTYDFMDRGRCREILEDYGLGKKIWRLVQRFWDDQAVVPNAGRYYNRTFRTDIRGTKGPPPHSFQNCDGHSGKDGAAGGLRPAGGTSYTGMVGREAQHYFICGKGLHIGLQTHMGAEDADSGGLYVREGWPADKPGKYEGDGL